MDDTEITYEKLCERYPPQIAEFLMREIEKADRQTAAANENKASNPETQKKVAGQ